MSYIKAEFSTFDDMDVAKDVIDEIFTGRSVTEEGLTIIIDCYPSELVSVEADLRKELELYNVYAIITGE